MRFSTLRTAGSPGEPPRGAAQRAAPVSGAGERAITVNGAASDVAPGTTVAELVATLAQGPRGLAVAVNGALVPRSRWETTALLERDRVEILGAAQGG